MCLSNYNNHCFLVPFLLSKLEDWMMHCGKSVTGGQKVLGNGDHVLLAISGVLGLTIAHWHVFTPDSDKNGLSSFGDAGTTSSLSGENAVLDSIVFMVDHEHVLLIADSDSAVLSSLSVSVGGLHDSGVLIAWNLLGGAILLHEIELVVGKLESLTGGPSGAIVAVNAGELVHVSDGPGVSSWIKGVLNLMNVCIPRHCVLFYR